jgi:hypothetical protein
MNPLDSARVSGQSHDPNTNIMIQIIKQPIVLNRPTRFEEDTTGVHPHHSTF